MQEQDEESRIDAEFMRRLHEEIGDSPFTWVRPEMIAARMRLQSFEVGSVVERLVRAEFVEQDYQDEVRLTDAGQREAAKLLSPMDIRGDHDARNNIFIGVMGDADTIQAGTTRSNQYVVTDLVSERPAIEEFLAALREVLDQLVVSDEQREIIRAYLKTAQV